MLLFGLSNVHTLHDINRNSYFKKNQITKPLSDTEEIHRFESDRLNSMARRSSVSLALEWTMIINNTSLNIVVTRQASRNENR